MRPAIICHMISSLDGRIRVDRWTPPSDGTALKTVINPYYEISRHYDAQAKMLGRNTVRIDLIPEIFDHAGHPPTSKPETHKGVRETDRVCIVLDPEGKTYFRKNEIGGENVISVLGEGVSDHYLEHLRGLGVSYIFAGKNGEDLTQAFATLKNEFGIEKIIHHGGGTTNGVLLKAGMIDELSLLIYPGVDGLVGMPSLFDCFGNEDELPAAGQSLGLIGVKQLDHDVIWLRYRFHQKP